MLSVCTLWFTVKDVLYVLYSIKHMQWYVWLHCMKLGYRICYNKWVTIPDVCLKIQPQALLFLNLIQGSHSPGKSGKIWKNKVVRECEFLFNRIIPGHVMSNIIITSYIEWYFCIEGVDIYLFISVN